MEAVEVKAAPIRVRNEKALSHGKNIMFIVADRQKACAALISRRHMGKTLSPLVRDNMADRQIARGHDGHMVNQVLDKGRLTRTNGACKKQIRFFLALENIADKIQNHSFLSRVGEGVVMSLFSHSKRPLL